VVFAVSDVERAESIMKWSSCFVAASEASVR